MVVSVSCQSNSHERVDPHMATRVCRGGRRWSIRDLRHTEAIRSGERGAIGEGSVARATKPELAARCRLPQGSARQAECYSAEIHDAWAPNGE